MDAQGDISAGRIECSFPRSLFRRGEGSFTLSCGDSCEMLSRFYADFIIFLETGSGLT